VVPSNLKTANSLSGVLNNGQKLLSNIIVTLSYKVA